MSHGIYTKRDFQISEEMAWHKLTRLAKPTIEHFPIITGTPLYYGDNKEELLIGDKHFLLPIASDDGLPVAPPYCEDTYTLFTPQEAWQWVSDVLEGTGYDVKSIGMLWGRSFWFISTELTELKSLTVGDGRKTNFMLNFSGGLDRKVSPQCELSSIVAVCHNTISLSRATGEVLFRERATKNFDERLKASKSEVEKAVGMAAVFKSAMDSLAHNPCSAARAERIFAGYVAPVTPKEEKSGEVEKMSGRTRNTVVELTRLHVKGTGNKGESEFDALNAFTDLYTHGKEDADVPMGRRFASSEYGNGAAAKADFFKLLTDRRNTLFEVEARGEALVALKA